jgi:hypothetical protein
MGSKRVSPINANGGFEQQNGTSPPAALVPVNNGRASDGGDSAVMAIPYAVAEAEPTKEESQFFTPARGLRALRRRWYLALPAAILGAIVAGVIANDYVSSVYTARTKVHIAINQPAVLYDKLGGGIDPTTIRSRGWNKN